MMDGWDIRPLCADDQHRIAHAFGLDRFAFEYRERAGSQQLRHWKIVGNEIEPVIPLGVLMEVTPTLGPLVQRVHPARQLAEVPPVRPFSLWDELMPFPWCLLSQVGSEALECSPGEWKQAAKDLVFAVGALEQRLFQAEVSVLSIPCGDLGPLFVFSHVVRKRFLTLGRLHSDPTEVGKEITLSRLAASFQLLELDLPQANSFPTQAALLGQKLAAPKVLSSSSLASGPTSCHPGETQVSPIL